jgi:nucleoside phosphorylase
VAAGALGAFLWYHHARRSRRAAELDASLPLLCVVTASEVTFEALVATMQLRAATERSAVGVVAFGSSPSTATKSTALVARVEVVCTGIDDESGAEMIGPEPAILTTMDVLERHRARPPNLVLHVGSCGVFRGDSTVPSASGVVIGETVVASRCFFFDRRIACFGEASRQSGVSPTAAWAPLGERSAGIRNIHIGPVGSGRSFDADEESIKVARGYGAIAKDMESAAVAYVCRLYGGVPFGGVLGVSNYCTGGEAAREHARHSLMDGGRLARSTAARVVEIVGRLDAWPVVKGAGNVGGGEDGGGGETGGRTREVRGEGRKHFTQIAGNSTTVTTAATAATATTAATAATNASTGQRRRGRPMIGVVVAMVNEAAPLARALGLQLVENHFVTTQHGIPVYTGERQGCTVVLVAFGVEDDHPSENRVGPEPATLVTGVLFRHWPNVDLVVNAGTAGAVPGSNLDIADVVVASKVLFFDRRLRVLGDALEDTALARYGVGLRSVWRRADELCYELRRRGRRGGGEGGRGGVGGSRVSSLPVSGRDGGDGGAGVGVGVSGGGGGVVAAPEDAPRSFPAQLALRRGIVGTAASFEMHSVDVDELQWHNVNVKEMEAAAVAFVCEVKRCPILVVKAITDHVGAATGHDDFLRNFESTMANLSNALPAVVDEAAAMLGGGKAGGGE